MQQMIDIDNRLPNVWKLKIFDVKIVLQVQQCPWQKNYVKIENLLEK